MIKRVSLISNQWLSTLARECEDTHWSGGRGALDCWRGGEKGKEKKVEAKHRVMPHSCDHRAPSFREREWGESWLVWQFVIRVDLLFISSALGPALAGAEMHLCCAPTGREPANTCHFTPRLKQKRIISERIRAIARVRIFALVCVRSVT